MTSSSAQRLFAYILHWVVCSFSSRGKAPDICLAQPNGLGNVHRETVRANGPAVCWESASCHNHSLRFGYT